jgi:hypothetical protein
MKKLRIAIYTICLNEEIFAQRFMDCAKEADGIFVTDTGSTDNTVKILEENGAIVHKIKMSPWRFDIPRNISMDFVPADYDILVCIDLDEILSPGWAEEIRKAWTPGTTRMRYQYIWNHLSDGRPGITFWYDKITCRHGYRWVKPVHEILQYYNGEEKQAFCETFTLAHFPDNTKSRGSYLPLLEQGCREEPNDDRNSHYLGREYMYYGKYDQAIAELQRHLSLPSATWNAERCASMRFIARSCVAKGDYVNAELWALKACAESSIDREPWLELGKVYYATQNWSGLYAAMKRLLTIVERPKSYICEVDAWYSLPHDYCSIAAFNLGMITESVAQCEKAIEHDPSDPRLKSNLQLMQSKL